MVYPVEPQRNIILVSCVLCCTLMYYPKLCFKYNARKENIIIFNRFHFSILASFIFCLYNIFVSLIWMYYDNAIVISCLLVCLCVYIFVVLRRFKHVLIIHRLSVSLTNFPGYLISYYQFLNFFAIDYQSHMIFKSVVSQFVLNKLRNYWLVIVKDYANVSWK